MSIYALRHFIYLFMFFDIDKDQTQGLENLRQEYSC